MFRVYNTSDCTGCSDPIACAVTQVHVRTRCIKLVNCNKIWTTTAIMTTTRKPIQPQSTSTIYITIGIIVSFGFTGLLFVVVKKNCCKQVRIPEQMILMSEINLN